MYLGGAAARERIWIQFDATGDARAMALATWAIVESLTSERVSRLKQPVLGRSRLAVAGPSRAVGRGPSAGVPLLDGVLGTTADVLAAMRRFQPTMVVHVQDWTGVESGHPGDFGGGREDAGRGGVFRLIESFMLERDVHKRLDRPGALRMWLGRPSKLARAVTGQPDAQVGGLTMAYVQKAMGGDADWPEDRGGRGAQVAIRLKPGRHIPRSAWRRMGAGNLAECALRELGAHGVTAQLLGGTPASRAARALAVAEGALVSRLNLETIEATR